MIKEYNPYTAPSVVIPIDPGVFFAGADAIAPGTMGEVTAHGIVQTFVEATGYRPAEFPLDARAVDSVTSVMEGMIIHVEFLKNPHSYPSNYLNLRH